MKTMAWFSRKKLLCLILTVYTAFAVLAAFSFAAAEPFRSIGFEIENQGSGKVSAFQETFFIQRQVEDPALFIKAGRVQFSPLRTGFQRLAFLWGRPDTGNGFSGSLFLTNKKKQSLTLKNTILLKLRI
jgi:hypothetical protein